MKTKILLLSIVAILIIGTAACVFWWLQRSQIITLDNGDKLTLVGVTYGKHHIPPDSKTTAAAGTARGRRGNRGAAFDTPADSLVVWLLQEHPANQWPQYQLYAYDKAGTACAGSSGRNSGYNGGNSEVVGVQFDAFPRRQSKFVLGIQEWGQNGQFMNEKRFVISNPARGSFPKWSPDALPNTQSDNDLEVTLTKLVFGANTTFNRNQDNPDDALNKGVQAVFNVSQNGKPVTNWQPVSIDTSDATGNHVNGWCNNQWQGNDDVMTYQFGLWPDEPAWKLHVEFSRTSGFVDSELWTLQNIPVQPGRMQDFWNYNNRRHNTNSVFAETDLNGFHLKIFPATQFTDQQQGNGQIDGGLRVQVTPSLPAGMRMTLAKVSDYQGQEVQSYNSGSSGDGKSTTYGYQLRDIDGVTNLNLTLALHKSRFVEFTAKPTKQ